MYVPPTKTDGGASDGVHQRCDIAVVDISSRGLNDVGRISLDRGSARGPGGPIPRSSIQERNERNEKGIAQFQIEPRGSLPFVGPHVRP